jgi:hypothetical protein
VSMKLMFSINISSKLKQFKNLNIENTKTYVLLKWPESRGER